MSWFNPLPFDAPKRCPRQIPKVVVPSFIGDEGIVLNLLCHEGTGSVVKDYSPYKNHGSVYGGVTWVDGPWGWALELDGSSGYLLVNDSPSLKNLSAVSVEIWINPILDGNAHDIVSKSRDNLDGSFWLRIRSYYDDIRFFVRIAGTNYGSPTHALVSGVWQHAVGVYDGSSLYLYYNGDLVGSSSAATGTLSTDEPLLIGRENVAGYEYYYSGMLALPRIYNLVLSPEEVKHHFESARTLFGV